MSYQRAYLHLFNPIGAIIQLIEDCSGGDEINVPLLLKQIQSEGEEIIISNQPKNQNGR